MNKKQIINEAKRVLRVELKSIKTLSSTFNNNPNDIIIDNIAVPP